MMKVAVQFEDAESFTQHDLQFHEALIHAALNIIIFKHFGIIWEAYLYYDVQ